MTSPWGGVKGGLEASLRAWRIPVQCHSHNVTMMAYIKCHSANNPLLHAIPKQKPGLESAAGASTAIPACQLPVCRGGSGGFSELGCTMNTDGHQEATLGPQSLLKTLAGCQGSSALQPRESHVGSLSGTRDLQGALGVIIFSRTLRLIVPGWATGRTIGMEVPHGPWS